MKLELDPTDLKSEYQTKGDKEVIDQKCNTRDVVFDKLNEQAQCAVRAIGKAVFFYAWDRRKYKAVYPPKEQ